MVDTRLIQVPYDSGHCRLRLGCGPERIVTGGLPDHLTALGLEVLSEVIETQEPFPMENQTSFELMGQVACRVTQALGEHVFPVILAGNCDVVVGSVSGSMPGRIGVIWFDAHSDFRTPERSYDGFLDAMGLAMLAGLCWRGATATVPGFRPLPPNRLLHVGSRPLQEEIVWLNEAGVGYLPAKEIHDKGIEPALARSLDDLARETDRIHLHLDLDVVDPAIAPASDYSRPGGLSPEQGTRAFEMIAERFEIMALDVTGYDPACDPEGKLLPIAYELIGQTVLSAAQARALS